jgi:hypothetical protein
MLSVNWRDLLLPIAEFRSDGMVKFKKSKWQPFEVRRDTVLRVWPERTVTTSAAVKTAIDWLANALKKPGGTDIPKPEWREDVCKKFRVSQRQFNGRIWPEAIERAGVEDKASRRGPKKKSNRTIVTPN